MNAKTRRDDVALPYEDLPAPEGTKLTVTPPLGPPRTEDLYSEEGLRLLAGLLVKAGAQHRIMYEPSWLGIPIIQFAEDVVMMQELVWKLRPDLVIECGVAHGGSAVLYASVLELLGHGRVLGVDVEIRKHNHVALAAHPLAHRIELLEGSSIAPATVDQVRAWTRGARTVLVVLDSNHTRDHVFQELQLYAPMVTSGSYLVAMDGAQAHVADIPRGKPEWRDDNPLVAIREFLAKHPEFRVDPHYTRLRVTSNPAAFLRKLTAEEMENA